MASLGKPLQAEACDRSPITRHVWIDITLQEMTLVHPVYICALETEPMLIGQDLLDRLAPLIDYQQGQIWAQVGIPKPLNSDGRGTSDKHITVIQEP